MRTQALRFAVVLASVSACAAESGSSGLGAITLTDSTDGSGKADALEGRTVTPVVLEERPLVGAQDVGIVEVVELDDRAMTVEGDLVRFDPPEESLQITVASTDASGQTTLRFLLLFRRDPAGEFEPLVLRGGGEFEDVDDVDAQTRGTDIDLRLSYYQSVSILAGDDDTITVASDGSEGQTTSELPFAAGEVEWAAFVFPTDSGDAPLTGRFEYALSASCSGGPCGEGDVPPVPEDIFAQARDVTLETITIDGPAPDSYTPASVDGAIGLGGTEFWQRWPGGHSPSFSYSAGTERGRACMQASAIRFETIMADPPESVTRLLDESNWSGRFFNWNDDFTEATSGDARGPVLWAWRTGLIKWISQTARDGTCHLPTLELVERAAEACLSTAMQDGGEIEGCAAQ